jgi:hypothetical protein
VNVFLYAVTENRELRDPTPIVEHDGERFTERPAPLRVNCSYIVTTWSGGNSTPANVTVEHQLLGQALTWLSRFPTIPARYLQGSLGAPGLIYPPPTMVAHMDPNQHTSDFWAAMGVSPRAAFHLVVTVELPLGAGFSGDLVLTRITDFEVAGTADLPWMAVGGRVVGLPADTGIADAIVDLVEISVRTRSAVEGRFRFPRVPRGVHTLRVVAQGFHPQTQPLAVPAPPEDLIVRMSPN